MIFLLAAFSFAGPVFSQSAQEDYMAAFATLARRNWPEAVRLFGLAIERNNADERLFIGRGEAHFSSSDYAAATADFEEANQILPGCATLWLAKTYAAQKLSGEACRLLAVHLDSPFRQPEEMIKKDPAFDPIQESSEWHDLWQKDWYTEKEIALSESKRLSRKGNAIKAMDLLNDALLDYPEDINLLSERAGLLYESGNPGSALADYQAAIRLDKTRMDLYLGRGKSLLVSGRYRDAVADFNRVLRSDPAAFAVYKLRAATHAGLGDFGQAIADLQIFLRYFPEDMEVQYLCGTYHQRAGDNIQALRYFNQLLREDPNNALYYKSRGMSYLASNTVKYAASDLSMSLDLNPGDPEAWMYLGIAKIRQGDLENGCSDLEKARQLGSTEVLPYIIEHCR